MRHDRCLSERLSQVVSATRAVAGGNQTHAVGVRMPQGLAAVYFRTSFIRDWDALSANTIGRGEVGALAVERTAAFSAALRRCTARARGAASVRTTRAAWIVARSG